MLFNSYEFILVYLPFTFAIYFLLNRYQLISAGTAWLVAASLIFYSYWNVAYLPLLLSSILFNFVAGMALSASGKESGQQQRVFHISRRLMLAVGVGGNLLLLGYFKYTDFLIVNINEAMHSDFPLPQIILPLGISFFTFTQIAYLVDTYTGKATEYSLLNYALFVSYFPHLIAGPILHHGEMIPQFQDTNKRRMDVENISKGVFIFTLGLAKKVLIADTLAIWVGAGYDNVESLRLLEAWFVSVAYTLQLYFDFSGYCDMAIGISLMFNIKLPINFNSPYKALDIQDFWRRWHMTLSRFLRDYLYVPLGGNRAGSLTIYRNLIITFLLGGLWHGANWTFILWGMLHGVALVIHRLWQWMAMPLPRFAAWLVTFLFVNFSWVLFRAESLDKAVLMLKGMVGLNGVILPSRLADKLSFLDRYDVEFAWWLPVLRKSAIAPNQSSVLLLVFLICIVAFWKNSNKMMDELRLNRRTAILTGICFGVSFIFLTRVTEFLYFNF